MGPPAHGDIHENGAFSPKQVSLTGTAAFAMVFALSVLDELMAYDGWDGMGYLLLPLLLLYYLHALAGTAITGLAREALYSNMMYEQICSCA